MRRNLAVWLLILGYAAGVRGAEPNPATEEIKAAVARVLPLIQKSGAEYIQQRQCFSCHHQGVPILALTTARARGFEVSEEGLQKQVQFTADFLGKNRENYQKGRGQGGQVATAGYALWALELGGWKPDPTTAAVAEYFLLANKDVDHWRTTARRPPSEVSHFTSNYLALRGLRVYGSAEQKERITARTGQVRSWLLKTPAEDTEDRVFRLWALKLAGAEGKEVKDACQELVQRQRQDGGWGQTAELESDAYATGSALVVLHHAAGLATSEPVYQRGLAFLLKAQQADGSWHIRSRSKPFQTYFESGFPHGKDQFISSAASSWAVTALALACPTRPAVPPKPKGE